MTAAADAKAAIYDLCVESFPDCQVSYGHPGPTLRNDIVAVMGITTETETGPMSPNRRRDEYMDVSVVISCYRGGDDQQSVTEIAYGYLDTLSAALQGSSHRLGGAVQTARLTSHDMSEAYSVTDQRTNKTAHKVGRVCEIQATITCWART